ncbi:MAG TPA: DNRLRE domain-containing protein [Flavitalea sp.]|nr:DNRLRE domain-containing protein [Flavitalea sp.]
MKKIGIYIFLAFGVLVSSFTCEKVNSEDPESEEKKLTLQPGPADGQDCLVAYRQTDNDHYAKSNHKKNPDVTAIRWTYNEVGAGHGTNRTYIKFLGLSEIPFNAEIISAKLSLYGVESGVAAPLGNSYYPGSPYEGYGENPAWLKRVLSDWTDSTITWNNKPATTDEHRVAVPASTAQWNFDAVDIDVTDMVREMVKANNNFGFCLELQKEEIYRSILFGSSEHENPQKRPKLEVDYSVSD